MTKLKNNTLLFIASLALCQGAGIIGSFFTANAINDWYQYLNKPSFNPPNWIFGPAWVTLYTLMAAALFLIWKEGLKNKKRKEAFILFLIHLCANAAWSIVFFGMRNPFLGFVNIIILWAFIILVLLRFYKINKTAGWLLVPYFLWVSFAAVLNFSLWQLN